ncbi:helix-turn-helix domain-containing protein, partial [Enterococcus faecalis]|nr:helix-turn-helix domain-containing protein [Enterococcus faecalis]ELZ4665433.1 helix-turn-helix domain-containing protein [Enterococcus faecalis]
MNSIDKQKFDLFTFIYFNDEDIYIKNITEYFLISNTSATRYIRELNEDLTIFFKDNFIQIKKMNNIYQVENKTIKPVAYIIDKIRLEYFKRTVQFRIIDALLTKKFQSIESLAIYLHISTPHLYKIIKKLNIILNKFEISISFRIEPRSSNFVSKKERNIRIFFCYYYWNIYKGIEWPFKKIKEPFLSNFKGSEFFTYSQIQRFNYLISISKFRMYSRKQFVTLNEEAQKDLSPYKKVNDFGKVLNSDSFTISEEISESEKNFFNFLIRFYIADCDDSSQKISIASKFLDSSTPLTIYTRQLLDHTLNTYKINILKEKWLLSYYNLNTILLYQKYVGLDYTEWDRQRDGYANTPSVNSALKKVEKNFISYYESTFKDIQPPFSVTDETVKYIAQYLFYLVDSNLEIAPVKICIQYGRLFYLNNQIKHNINILFQSKNIEYVDTPVNANLIISDSYQGESQKATYFYFYDIHDKNNWQSMFAVVEKLLYDKIIMAFT